MQKNLFIAGVEKSGTTSLANWLVSHQLVSLLSQNSKEPYTFALHDQSYDQPGERDGWVLDASVGYCNNPLALSRMPSESTKIVLCLRNQFDRTWSAYRMYKLEALGGRHFEALRERFPMTQALHSHELIPLFFPPESRAVVRSYVELERSRLREQSFLERVHYEMAFFLSRSQFPFYSVLLNSFFVRIIRNLSAKFRPDQIHLISVNKLNDQDVRRSWLQNLLSSDCETTSPSVDYSAEAIDHEIDGVKPDFSHSDFDFLRMAFASDLSNFLSIVRHTGIELSYVDDRALHQSLSESPWSLI